MKIKKYLFSIILITLILTGLYNYAAVKDTKVKISIDTKKTKEPISKYIYGQFIEHLGRCIYGGIWAEMLEDRKFYFPVSENPQTPWDTTKHGAVVLVRTPWKVIGIGPDKIKKVHGKESYGPDGALKIGLLGNGKPTGIYQHGLSLIKNKEYIGRVLLAGTSDSGPIQISLIWGDDHNAGQTIVIDNVKNTFTKVSLKFKAGETTQNAKFEIIAKGKGSIRIAATSLMPADNIKGFRPDTLALLKELNSPVYRWPGGNFVSGYNWKDGIGDQDKRPTRKNPAWTGLEYNDVGIHEFMNLCELLNTEPYIALNTGAGDEILAAQEVEYCNGDKTTSMGKLRAMNGRAEPYNVKWWAVGNEMWGDFQIGHMPLEEYVKKHNKVVDKIWAVDPSIVPIAVGRIGNWSETMLKVCMNHMNLISEHFYCWKKFPIVLKHIDTPRSHIKKITDAHREYRRSIKGLPEKNIRIAMDEWNYWYRKYVPEYGELGCRYDLKDGLGIAAGLHEFFRNSDIVFMANYAQTVNVIGCIKTTKTAAAFATTGLVLKLYRREFGVIPVETSGNDVSLDICAAWTKSRKALTVSIVNPTPSGRMVSLDIKGAEISGKGKKWWITGKAHDVYNEPGKEPKVIIREAAVTDAEKGLRVAPISVTLFRLEVRN